MLPVHKPKGLIPSPKHHQQHAQFPNLCFANSHPQLHDRTAVPLSIKIDGTATPYTGIA